MNVLHVTLAYKNAPALGGPNDSVYRLVQALLKRTVHSVVVCTNWVGKGTSSVRGTTRSYVDGCPVTRLEARSIIRVSRHSFGAFYVPELKRELREQLRNVDLAHLHGYRDYLTMVGAFEARRAGIPYVVQPRGTLPAEVYNSLVKRVFDQVIGGRILRNASGLVALSGAEREQFVAVGCDRDAVTVIPNGVMPDVFPTGPRSNRLRVELGIKEREVVLYLGRIHFLKGVDTMVAAVAELRRRGRDVAAAVVGPDEGFLPDVRRRAAAAGLTALYWRDTVSGSHKAELIRSADAFVYATQTEALGLGAFEAILSGIPTVVSESTGCGEFVRELNAGWEIPYGSVPRLADTLETILSNPEASRQRVAGARAHVVTRLSWERTAEATAGLYERLSGR